MNSEGFEHRMRRREFAPRAVNVREGNSDDSDPESRIDFLLAEEVTSVVSAGI